jgi:hypothetical protein
VENLEAAISNDARQVATQHDAILREGLHALPKVQHHLHAAGQTERRVTWQGE